MIEYSFGILNWGGSIDQIKEIDQNVSQFHQCQGEAIYVFFTGVVNHWVTVVVHKTDTKSKAQLYLLDSSNAKHLAANTIEEL